MALNARRVGTALVLVPALLALGCAEPAEMTLDIRVPSDDQGLFDAVSTLNITATRDGVVLAQSSFSATASSVALTGVAHGPRTVVALEGVDLSGQVIARGKTCPLDLEGPNTIASLYFSPTNFFAPTVGSPTIARTGAVGSALSDGTVLVVGGADEAGAVIASGELFSPDHATFEGLGAVLARARVGAQSILVPDVGLLIVGGLDAARVPVAEAELYLEAQQQILPLLDPRLDGRVGHKIVLLPDGRVLVVGGVSADGVALTTTVLISLRDDGTYQASRGPGLYEARRDHAATVAAGIPIVFGGYGASGGPLNSIEAIDFDTATGQRIGSLRRPRAEATATVIGDGSILLTGGVGAEGVPLADAELFNPITRSTVVYALASPRRGHSATPLPDGRVMIAGGVDASGVPIKDVELFAVGVGFLSERRLGTARSGHLAIPLCDDTVLFVGGGSGAELYTGAPR